MEKLKKTFDKILKATSPIELEKICDSLPVPRKHHLDLKKYHKLDISLSIEEIINLKMTGVLTDSYDLNVGMYSTPLERLLYAALWKQGDLLKVKHIVQGIIFVEKDNLSDNKKDGLILYNCGKSIKAGSKDPIVDQHVLRAFAIYQKELQGDSFDESLLKSKFKSNLIACYKNWIFHNFSKQILDDSSFKYHLDRILYALGKNLKN